MGRALFPESGNPCQNPLLSLKDPSTNLRRITKLHIPSITCESIGNQGGTEIHPNNAPLIE